jgi:hypothetical protein
MSTNRQNQSTTGKLGNQNGPDLVQAFPKKWWVESDFTAPNLPLPLRLKVPIVTITAFLTILGQIRGQKLTTLATLTASPLSKSHY